MKGDIEERAYLFANYIIETGATVRAAAKKFAISKSTVHKDVTERLRSINRDLFEKTQAVLAQNKSERHLRGGAATKKKYEEQKK